MEEPATELLARLETLGHDVAAIRERVDRLEARLRAGGAVDSLAVQRSTAPLHAQLQPTAPAEGGELADAVSLTGRALLVMGGAYLLRATADAGIAPPAETAIVALAYAAWWFVAGERSARAGRRRAAVAYDLVAIAIAYPLVLEATLRLRLLSAAVAAACLVAFFALGLWVAERQRLGGIAWLNTVAALTSLLALQVGTRAMLPFAFALLAVAMILEREALEDRWLALRWPAALALDGAVALSVFIATRPEELPPGYAPLPLAGVTTLALLFASLFVASVASRTFLRGRAATGFEMVQLPLALLIGLGGAERALAADGLGHAVVGWASLLLGAGFALAAFLVIERHAAPARNFYLYSTAGAALMLAATGMLLEQPLLTLCWCGLATVAALLGSRFGRVTLRFHALAYAVAAAAGGGLLQGASFALLAPAGAAWPSPGTPALLAFATMAVCYAAPLGATRADATTFASLLSAGLTAAAAVLCGAGLAVGVLVAALRPFSGDVEAAQLAALRTLVGSLAAVALAWAAQRSGRGELTWVAYGVLIGTGLKLVAEDLRVGRPATLFAALASYGAALIAASRLLRSQRYTKEPIR